MRINRIELKNFKAFYSEQSIDLHNSGHNLLLYGENGTGKSSLAHALRYFLESSVKDHDIAHHKNIFVEGQDSYVKLFVDNSPHEWTETAKADNPIIIDASKTKGFIDYRILLETYFINKDQDNVNVFSLLVKNLLANTVNDITSKSFGEDWEQINRMIPKRNYQSYVRYIEEKIKKFNDGLKVKLAELKDKTTEILNEFGYDVEIAFKFDGIAYEKHPNRIDNQNVLLKVKYRRQDIYQHHHFLNEARLTAIALSIYFASLLLTPSSDLKLLILDDALIGLDMSNRLPVLDLLKKYFSDYQKFIMTYDKAWYEIVKQRTQGEHWKYLEMYSGKVNEIECPICSEDKPYIEKAKDHFQSNDYKAAVVYIRTAFEDVMKNYSSKHCIPVGYQKNPKKLTSDDFWLPLTKHKKKDGSNLLTDDLKAKIGLYKSIILNPLSHAVITDTYKAEINDAILTVEELNSVLTA